MNTNREEVNTKFIYLKWPKIMINFRTDEVLLLINLQKKANLEATPGSEN